MEDDKLGRPIILLLSHLLSVAGRRRAQSDLRRLYDRFGQEKSLWTMFRRPKAKTADPIPNAGLIPRLARLRRRRPSCRKPAAVFS